MSSKRVLILGGGMIGSAMAKDLAADQGRSVTVADVRSEVLQKVASRTGAATVPADLANPTTVRRLSGDYDFVIGALPSVFGLQTLRAVIESGRNYCDISFMPENALDLDDLARERGVTAVVDCGVAPGVSNMMVGFADAQLDSTEKIEIYVGGIPVERRWPFDYKAGFAPFDVIEEYVRPARLVENGRIVVREALSEPEMMDFPGVGTLEAFNTDGLRSLAYTLRAPFMKEKTLRYPGHVELMKAFRETGLFSKEPLKVGDQMIRPLDATAALLFPKWTFAEGEEDLTVLRVVVEGTHGPERVRYTWDLLDRYDAASGLRSMSRTTAFPCTLASRLVMDGEFARAGVNPPEFLGAQPGVLAYVLRELEARGVRCREKVVHFVPDVEPVGELVGAR
jgi:saccharopine dehydrogenase-like NADP-dependent oxidoreductase